MERQRKLNGVIKELNERLEKLAKEREEIVALVDRFEGLNQKILKMKYIDGLTLESIANETGYDYQYIKNKHAEIMRIIRFNKG